MKSLRARRQAGGIVFRLDGEVPSVLIVTAFGNSKRWVLPKGSVKRFERGSVAALREVREEAGVEGRIVGKARLVEVKTSTGRVSLQYYLVEHLRDLKKKKEKKKEKRIVQWYPVEDAIQQLSFASARKSLLDANPEIVRLAHKSDRKR